MSTSNKELSRLVEGHFGIKVVDWLKHEHFDATKMTIVHQDRTQTVLNKGVFRVHNFFDDKNDRYKLVHYEGNFSEDKDLVDFMKYAELDDVKDYELVMPSASIKNYTLYKLIPYKVNGLPVWN